MALDVAPERSAAETFPIEAVRSRFPSVTGSAPFVFLDNGGGAQCPQSVLDRVANHLLNFNVQRGGRYPKSIEVDRVVADARVKVAALVNAYDPREIAF